MGFIGLVVADALAAQRLPPSQPGPLEFLGFRPGLTLSEVDSQLRRTGGEALRCQRATADTSVSECRASLADAGGRAVTLWLSAIDARTGVLTISGPVTAAQLDSWRLELERQYGPSRTYIQGTQRMLQWIRERRMLRLTWRAEPPMINASVSLVDGAVLDEWGRRRDRGPTRRSDSVSPSR